MAKPVLPVNFQDDILNASMSGKRRYMMINNPDGTVSLEDASSYDQVGNEFGAGQINATNQAINESVDKANVIDNIDDVVANQTSGKVAGANALKQVNSNLGLSIKSIDGVPHWSERGADTWSPFKSELKKAIKSTSVKFGSTTGVQPSFGSVTFTEAELSGSTEIKYASVRTAGTGGNSINSYGCGMTGISGTKVSVVAWGNASNGAYVNVEVTAYFE